MVANQNVFGYPTITEQYGKNLPLFNQKELGQTV